MTALRPRLKPLVAIFGLQHPSVKMIAALHAWVPQHHSLQRRITSQGGAAPTNRPLSSCFHASSASRRCCGRRRSFSAVSGSTEKAVAAGWCRPHDERPMYLRSGSWRNRSTRPTSTPSRWKRGGARLYTSSDDPPFDGADASTRTETSTDGSIGVVITEADVAYMKLAAEYARLGWGNTYPNPAVGCVLVRRNPDGDESDGIIIGSGFHPLAGMPHAEVFALFEACGHLPDGVAAAKTVLSPLSSSPSPPPSEDRDRVLNLLDQYASPNGPDDLFDGAFSNDNEFVTAYVTLEPCCHFGKTPPCAASLVKAGVRRVVVGYRDPNPRVDGGGVLLLEDAGVRVDLMRGDSKDVDEEEGDDLGGSSCGSGPAASPGEREAAAECADVVKYFVKRIAPQPDGPIDYGATINGVKRAVLRSLAGRQKAEGTMAELEWPTEEPAMKDGPKMERAVESLPIDHRWLEAVDAALWEKELVLLRLNRAVAKKNEAKVLGARVADELRAHVAQVVGHTALLFRPGIPPVLDLDELVLEKSLKVH